MQTPPPIPSHTPSHKAAPNRPQTREEIKALAKHASTIWVGQMAVMAFGITDTVVIGWHSQQDLAGLSVGAAIYICVYVSIVGMISGFLPVFAERHGAQDPQGLTVQVQQSVYLAFCATLLGMAALAYSPSLLPWAQVPPQLHAPLDEYLKVLALALPATIVYRLYGTLQQALGKPRNVTLLQLAGLAVKIPLTVVLVGGAQTPWGQLAAWGLVGAGAASLCSFGLMAVIASLWARRSWQVWRALHGINRLLPKPQGAVLWQQLKITVPSGLTVLAEVGAFALLSILVARLGITASAAMQIASNLVGVMYMVPLSLSIASSARVSYWLGAGQEARAIQSLKLGFYGILGSALLLCSAVLLGRPWIVQAYTQDPATAAIAAGLLVWITAYHLPDALQTFGVFLLRSFGVSTLSLVVYIVLLWGLGIGGGYWLVYHSQSWLNLPSLQDSPAGFWATNAVALVGVAAITLGVLRFKSEALKPSAGSF